MIEIYKTEDGILQKRERDIGGLLDSYDKSLGVELLDISERTNIDINHLRSPLDEEERARIEVEDNYTVILVDIQPWKGT